MFKYPYNCSNFGGLIDMNFGYEVPEADGAVASTPIVAQEEIETLTTKDPLQIQVLGLLSEGAKSRVETLIKLDIKLAHSNQWSFIRINKNMLVKSKIRKSEHQKPRQGSSSNLVEFSDESKILNLEAKVIHSDNDKTVKICEMCINREKKRSERIKNGKPRNDHEYLLEKDRILLFNCDSLLNFSTGIASLPTRITCYCRHHEEKVGFRISFVLKNDKNETIATGLSPPIMITDDHKNQKNKNEILKGKKRQRSTCTIDPVSPTPSISRNNSITLEPYLPTGINMSQPDPVFTDFFPTPPSEYHQSFKRYKDDLLYLFSPIIQEHPSPVLDRIVPAQGPITGGTEVTLLGSGFYQGLTCFFGDRPANTTAIYPNTITCIVPQTYTPGPVVVSFKDHSPVLESKDMAIFNYYDTNYQSILEIALRIIGVKETGIAQSAKDVAIGIIRAEICRLQNQQNSLVDCNSPHFKQVLFYLSLLAPNQQGDHNTFQHTPFQDMSSISFL